MGAQPPFLVIQFFATLVPCATWGHDDFTATLLGSLFLFATSSLLVTRHCIDFSKWNVVFLVLFSTAGSDSVDE